jgi:PilZ domain
VEQRGSVRYRLVAPAVFCWTTGDGEILQHKGATRDISASGAFISAQVSPPANADLKLEIFLPALACAEGAVRLTARALVVRVERLGDSDDGGFAVVSEGFVIPELASQNGPIG